MTNAATLIATKTTDQVPTDKRPSREAVENAIRVLLASIDDNPDREGLKDTPKRVAKSYLELFSGYQDDPEDILDTTFEEVAGYDNLVLVKDIPFTSHCEHHMVPFRGTASIAYYPKDGVVGLSKLARLVDCYAKRLQTQETMTAQISDAIETHLQPLGSAILVNAEHMCMCMRGVMKEGTSTTTLRFRGKFTDEVAERAMFLQLLGK